mgnify:CR=1 FL=1
MSFLKLGKDLFENKTIIFRPSVTYISSSDSGVQGSITVKKRQSDRIRSLEGATENAAKGVYLDELKNNVDNADAGATLLNMSMGPLFDKSDTGDDSDVQLFDGSDDGVSSRAADIRAGALGSVPSYDFKSSGFDGGMKLGVDPDSLRIDDIFLQPGLFNRVQEVLPDPKDNKVMLVSASFFDYKTSIGIGRVGSETDPEFRTYHGKVDLNQRNFAREGFLDRETALTNLTQEVDDGPQNYVLAVPKPSPNYNDPDSTSSQLNFKFGEQEVQRKASMLRMVKNVLYDKHSTRYDDMDFSIPNYNCFNFFTSSNTPNNGCFVYPNQILNYKSQVHWGQTSGGASNVPYRIPNSVENYGGPYTLGTEFTFDFWINPKYSNDEASKSFNAGTILHHSGAYAISLVSGSSRDENGLVDGYRIMLQLSHSADVPPSQVSMLDDTGTAFDSSGLPGKSRRNFPQDQIFLSDDNALRKNHWHRVSIRWSTTTNNKVGDIFVSDETGARHVPSTFYYASASINNIRPDSTLANRNLQGKHGPNLVEQSQTYFSQQGVFFGNYYEGPGSNVPKFFGKEAATSDGVAGTMGVTEAEYGNVFTDLSIFSMNSSANIDSSTETFRHPLNAEIHDVKFFKDYLNDAVLEAFRERGVVSVRRSQDLTANRTGLSTELTPYPRPIFYVPCYFTPKVTQKNQYASPFNLNFERQNTPTNINLSLGSGGRLVNTQNYLKEFRYGNFPRQYHLSSSVVLANSTGVGKHSVAPSNTLFTLHDTNRFIYEMNTGDGTKEARIFSNLFILPCDNGLHKPNHGVLYGKKDSNTGIGQANKFVTELVNTRNASDKSSERFLVARRFRMNKGYEHFSSDANSKHLFRNQEYDVTRINLRDCLHTKYVTQDGSVDTTLSSRNFSYIYFPYAYITGDVDSNEVSLFSVSNLYYGERIHPGSFVLTDTNVTGSTGKVQIKLRDNGKSGLYRADCLTKQADWNHVGNVFYEEGVVLYKSPHPAYFGKENYEMRFKGEQSTHMQIISVPAPQELLNVSKNTTYQPLSSSLESGDLSDNEFVYITGVNLHDNNLNVIGRANLAQPIKKRRSDKFLFKLKMDY